MAKRLTRITTKTGDKGQSGLADGSRLSKSDLVFEALGTVDELNSALGVVVVALGAQHQLSPTLLDIQSRLFDLGAALSLPRTERVLDGAIARLDAAIGQHNAELPPLTEFVLPGGTATGAAMHVTRTIARRAERILWRLIDSRPDDYDASLAVYLNRLSDLCFVLARVINREAGVAETLWAREDQVLIN